MARDLKFIGWKSLELVLFVLGLLPAVAGSWLLEFSDRCGRRARAVRDWDQ